MSTRQASFISNRLWQGWESVDIFTLEKQQKWRPEKDTPDHWGAPSALIAAIKLPFQSSRQVELPFTHVT